MSFKRHILVVILAVTSGTTVFADDTKNVNWGLDASLGYQQQNLESSTAKLSSFDLDPSLQINNWDFSLSLPWYKIQGRYFLNGTRPLLQRTCDAIQNLSAQQIKNRIQRKSIKKGITLTEIKIDERYTSLTNSCAALDQANNEYHTGLGDVSGFTHYSIALDESSVWNVTTGLGYKTDSGDAEVGLGSGTKDTMIELGIGMVADKNTFTITLGYSFVASHDSAIEIYLPNNYAYTNLDFSRALTNWLTLGANIAAQQAYIEGGDATKSITAYSDFMLSPQLNLHIYTSRYGKTSYSPQSEVGANIRYSF